MTITTTNIVEGKLLVAAEARTRAVAVVGDGDGTEGGTSMVAVALMNADGPEDGANDGLTVALFIAGAVGQGLTVALSTVGTSVLLVFALEGDAGSDECGACDDELLNAVGESVVGIVEEGTAVALDALGKSVVSIIVEGTAVFVTSIQLGISDGGSSTVSAGDITGASVCWFFCGDLEGWDEGRGPSGGVG